MKTACAHQPNFLPWLGTVAKIARADVYLVMDNVQFSRPSWTQRVKIGGAEPTSWLTVPVRRYAGMIHEMTLDSRSRWKKKHLGTLRQRYAKTPYFNEVMALLRPVYEDGHERLLDFNMALLEAVMRFMGLPFNYILGSSLDVSGAGSELVAGMVLAAGAERYLAGDGAGGYEDEEAYRRAGIEYAKIGFETKPYEQAGGGFRPGLSIVDALMNLGPSGTKDVIL